MTDNTAAPVVPGTPRWEELVTMGIIKDADRNWFLGDAALEINPMGEDASNNGAVANLEKYAASIGIKFNTLMSYRQVAANWPPNNRILGTSWRVHQFLMAEDDRKLLIEEAAKLAKGERVTVTRAHELKDYSTAGRPGVRAAAKTVKDVKDLLTDPVVRSIFEEQPDLIAALPEDVVKAFVKTHGADAEQEALIVALEKDLASTREEREKLLAKLGTAGEATADVVRVATLERTMKELAAENARLETEGAKSEEARRKNAKLAKALAEERDQLRKIAAKRREELDTLKALDPDREGRAEAMRQYRALSDVLLDIAGRATRLDNMLAEPLLVEGDHKKSLIEMVDDLAMHWTVIRSKLGADWDSHSELGQNNN